jgi:hypothetical protein
LMTHFQFNKNTIVTFDFDDLEVLFIGRGKVVIMGRKCLQTNITGTSDIEVNLTLF